MNSAESRQIVARHNDRAFMRFEVEAAFNLVANATNWKLPIDAVVDAVHMDAIAAAVPFFAGCQARFTPAGVGRVRVQAVGYYAAVGA